MEIDRSIKNFGYLISVQVINYLFPLLSFGITAHALGVDGLGKLALCQAIILYFQQFTDFGFNLTATRNVALNKCDEQAINITYTTTIVSKVLFSLLSVIVIAAGCFLFDQALHEITVLLSILMLGVVASVFYPVWLFQGLEKMQFVLYSNLVSKITILGMLAFFVQQPEDLNIAAAAQSLSWVCVAAYATWQVKKHRYAKFVSVSKILVLTTIKESFYIYLSVISTSFYSTFNVIFIGTIFNQQLVAYYSVADKIKGIFQSLISAVCQALYPKFCERNVDGTAGSNTRAHIFLFFLLGLIGTTSIQISAPYVIEMVAGKEMLPAVDILRIISLVLPIVSVASYLATLRIAASGKTKLFFKIYSGGAIIHLIYVYPIAKLSGYAGVAACVVVTELVITAMLFYASSKLVKDNG
ncbi:flippase [Pseudaeromonas sharmana]|uniref:Flippase n=1 Tax=Pseudaeromonas sharmana TaxID=328412 RepID=A0ABV8CS78_9GAMM